MLHNLVPSGYLTFTADLKWTCSCSTRDPEMLLLLPIGVFDAQLLDAGQVLETSRRCRPTKNLVPWQDVPGKDSLQQVD
jgi:hypothetical protein